MAEQSREGNIPKKPPDSPSESPLAQRTPSVTVSSREYGELQEKHARLLAEHQELTERFRQREAEYGELLKKYTDLLERTNEFGFDALDRQTQVVRDSVEAMHLLRILHEGLHFSARELYKLPKAMKQDLRDAWYRAHPNDPFAKRRIDEVLKKPKKSRL